MRDTHQYLPCSNPTAEPSSYRYRPGLATWLTRSADPRTLPVGSLADLCDPGSLTNTLTQTERILAVAITSGMYQMADIALTYQLTGPSSDAAHPADRLQTNNFHPKPLSTLESNVRHDLGCRRNAHALGLHPDAINNRIAEVLRRDPGRISTITEISASLTGRPQSTAPPQTATTALDSKVTA